MALVNVALQPYRTQSLPRVLRAAMEQNMPTANTSSGRQISFRNSRAVQLVDVLQQNHHGMSCLWPYVSMNAAYHV